MIRQVSTALNQPRQQTLAGAWSTWALGLVFNTFGVPPDGSTEHPLPGGQSVSVLRFRPLTFKTHKLGRGVDLREPAAAAVVTRMAQPWVRGKRECP